MICPACSLDHDISLHAVLSLLPTKLHRTCKAHRSVPTSCGPAHRHHLTSQNAMLDPSWGLSHLPSLLLRSLFFSSSSFCGSQSSGRLLDVIVRPWVQPCARYLPGQLIKSYLLMNTEEYIEYSWDLNRSNNFIEKDRKFNELSKCKQITWGKFISGNILTSQVFGCQCSVCTEHK